MIPRRINTAEKASVYLTQYALKRHGYDVGALDGLRGSRTKKAEKAFAVDATSNPNNSSYPQRMHTSPNKGGVIAPKGVIFHHTAGSFNGSLSWCLTPKSRVSYHIIVEEDGTRHELVPLTMRAWHAGKSSFMGQSGCNGFMVGFAFSGNTYDRKLTGDEIRSAVEFVRLNKDRYGWTLATMTDHRTVSPSRKNDLNPEEWERLKAALAKAF